MDALTFSGRCTARKLFLPPAGRTAGHRGDVRGQRYSRGQHGVGIGILPCSRSRRWLVRSVTGSGDPLGIAGVYEGAHSNVCVSVTRGGYRGPFGRKPFTRVGT
jgi:hypothetical protein